MPTPQDATAATINCLAFIVIAFHFYLHGKIEDNPLAFDTKTFLGRDHGATDRHPITTTREDKADFRGLDAHVLAALPAEPSVDIER